MRRILVVDDEPIIRAFLADSLADAGYQVTTATNGAEALDRANDQIADLVLLDLLMPAIDGLTFLRERQSHTHLARVPVVVLSARWRAINVARIRCSAVRAELFRSLLRR